MKPAAYRPARQIGDQPVHLPKRTLAAGLRALLPALLMPTILMPCAARAGDAKTAADTAAAAARAPAAPDAMVAKLIPRRVLFGNPTRAAATISPDGGTLAWLAPSHGVMNVYVAPRAKPDHARLVTHETARPVRDFFFSPDSRQILYLQDHGGDENFLLYGVDLKTLALRNYTPFEKTRVEIAGGSPLHKQELVIGLNNRDPHWHDLYRLHLDTGKLEFMRKGDGYAGFTLDYDLVPRLATRANDDGSYTVQRLDADGSAHTLFDIPFADAYTTAPGGIPLGADYLYMVDSRGRDTAALARMDLKSGKLTQIAQDSQADLGGTLGDPQTGQIHAYSVEYLKTRWVALDDVYRADIALLDAHAAGEWGMVSRTDDDQIWIVVIDRVSEPAAYWLYDRKARKLDKLFTARPALEAYRLAPMQALTIPARDGKTLTAYLTLPLDSAPPPAAPPPMVLSVHGGPWARDSYGYDPTHQWLANRGYGVLSVNFRGSTGFGKAFVAAGDKQWGRAMQDDLLDAKAWLVAHKLADPDRVAIMGGSYGGYATLAALSMTPTAFACGVDIVGPSNLQTLLESIPPYWKSGFEQMAQRIGDPRTEAGRQLLHARSPLTYAKAIMRPLLIGQGANDPRVHKRESDQIVAAMRAQNIPVTYVLYPDEGHGFARPENRLSFNAVTKSFLGRCLGGRVEPAGEDFHGATLQFLAGKP